MTQRATRAATRASKSWAAETVKVREREREMGGRLSRRRERVRQTEREREREREEGDSLEGRRGGVIVGVLCYTITK